MCTHRSSCIEVLEASDVRWKIFPHGKFSRKFSAIFFQKIFRFLKSSLNISFFNIFLVALGYLGDCLKALMKLKLENSLICLVHTDTTSVRDGITIYFALKKVNKK